MKHSSDLDAALTDHGPLGRWYAEPMAIDIARQQLERWSNKRQQRLRQGRGDAVSLRLACAVARFHLGENIESEMMTMEGLFHQRCSPRALTLLHLIHGQLLASRQLSGANDKLSQGFRLANHLLHPQDYFSLLHRHNLLQRLPVTSRTEAEPLKRLLQTAAVQKCLEITQKPLSRPQLSSYF